MPAIILHIISGLEIGGAETALLRLLKYGLAEEYDCHVLSLAGEGPLSVAMKECGATLHYPTNKLLMQWPLIGHATLKAINELDPLIVQGWMYHGNIAASVGCRLSRKSPQLIWNIRASLHNVGSAKWLTRRLIDLGGRLSKQPKAVIYNSQTSLKLHAARGYSQATSLVIPNGFDPDLFKPCSTKRRNIRRELNIPAEAILVTHLGRFHPDKGQIDFIRAASKCLLSFPDTFYLMGGPGVDSASVHLQSEISNENESQIRIIGARTDADAVLAASDIYVSSSRTESFPNTLGEAMATGLASIATDVGDCSLLIGESGKIVPPMDVEALAHAIESFISSKELRDKIGLNARDRIKQNYTIQVMVTRYSDLYNTVLKAESSNLCVA